MMALRADGRSGFLAQYTAAVGPRSSNREETYMIKVTVLYPNTDGCRFDFEYYCSRHMPMVRDKLGDACRGIAVERGLSGDTPGSSPRYIAMAHLFFDSVEAFQNAFGPHADEIMSDIPNYTDVAPVLEIGEVLINARRSDAGPFHLHL